MKNLLDRFKEMLGLSTASELNARESYFLRLSELSPVDQRESLKVLIATLKSKQDEEPNEVRAWDLEFLGKLVSSPIDEMAKDIRQIKRHIEDEVEARKQNKRAKE